MLYSFELQMAGVILLSAMAAGGISLWLKRRRAMKESDETRLMILNPIDLLVLKGLLYPLDKIL